MSSRSGWGIWALLAVLVTAPLLEAFLIVQAGRLLGIWPTIGILLFTSALGAWLARREGSRAWTALSSAFGYGRMPTGELADAALVLTGGLMLIFPGFLTDVIGLLFLLPATRPLARVLIATVIARTAHRRGINVDQVQQRAQMAADVAVIIKGETVDPAPPGSPVIRTELDR